MVKGSGFRTHMSSSLFRDTMVPIIVILGGYIGFRY